MPCKITLLHPSKPLYFFRPFLKPLFSDKLLFKEDENILFRVGRRLECVLTAISFERTQKAAVNRSEIQTGPSVKADVIPRNTTDGKVCMTRNEVTTTGKTQLPCPNP